MKEQKSKQIQDWHRMIVLPARVVVRAPPAMRERVVGFAGAILKVLLDHGRRAGVDPLWEGCPVPQFHALVTELGMLAQEARDFGDAGVTDAQALIAATADARGALMEAPPLFPLEGLDGLRYRPFAVSLIADDGDIPGLAALDRLICDTLTHQPTVPEQRAAWQEDRAWIRTVLAQHIAARDAHDPRPAPELRPYCRLAGQLAGRLGA
jgi:hypothetical protein